MLQELLEKERTTIVKRWFNLILDTYQEDTSRFLKKEKDPFANPVGFTMREGIESLYRGLLVDLPSENMSVSLDKMIRIRSVQDFSPNTAVSFVFLLKKVVREVLKREIRNQNIYEELAAFESRVDHLALLAFETYVKCREELFELRAKELKGHRDAAVRMLARTNLSLDKIQQGEKP